MDPARQSLLMKIQIHIWTHCARVHTAPTPQKNGVSDPCSKYTDPADIIFQGPRFCYYIKICILIWKKKWYENIIRIRRDPQPGLISFGWMPKCTLRKEFVTFLVNIISSYIYLLRTLCIKDIMYIFILVSIYAILFWWLQ